MTPTRVSNKYLPFIIIGAVVIMGLIAATLILNTSDNNDPIIRDDKSLAVLPFENRLGDGEAFFVSGITEDIRNQIDKIGDLRVLSRFTINDYQSRNKSVKTIGEELEVSYLLAGDIRRDQGKLMVTCKIIDTETEQESWSESFQGQEADIFSIQNNIALRLASILESNITPEERKKIEARNTFSVSAYNIYLQGRALYQEYNAADNEQAISYFKKALIQDRDYALALAGMSDAYSQAVKVFGTRDITYLDSAVATGARSVEVDPDLAEGWKALGLASYFKGDYAKAKECYKKSLSFNPNYIPALSNLASILGREGKLMEAILIEERSIKLDPINFISFSNLAEHYHLIGLEEKAEEFAELTMQKLSDETAKTEVSHDLTYFIFKDSKKAEILLNDQLREDSLGTLTLEGICKRLAYYHPNSRLDSLVSLIIRRPDYNSQLHTSIPVIQAAIQYKAGNADIAEDLIKEQLTYFLNEKNKGNNAFVIEIAICYSLLNDKENTIKALDYAIEQGYTNLDVFEYNRYLNKFKNEPEFQSLINGLKQRLVEVKNELTKNREEV